MNILSQLRLRTKLGLLMGLSAVALIACVVMAASVMHQRMINDRIDKVRSVVLAASGFAASLEAQVAAGHLTRAQAIAAFRDDLHRVRFGAEDDYLLVQDINGVVLMHGGDPTRENKPTASKDRQGRSTGVLIQDLLRDGDSGVISYTALKPGAAVPQDKISFVALFKPWDMVFIAGAWLDDVDAAYQRTLRRLGTMGGGILLVTLIIAWLINHDISGSLGALQAAMHRLAQGDLSLTIPGTDRRDELREMAAAVEVFKQNAIEVERLRAEQDAAARRAAEEKARDMARIADEFETNVGAIVSVVASAATEMATTAEALTTVAEQTALQSTAVAAASEQASTNVQAVAGAAEELSGSVAEISRQVASSSAIATKAVGESERSNTLVASLADAAQKIGAVTAMINGIASQTNLLALNATIEAARAGEAGKGFAVVASEVKNLATQTAKATEEISGQIAAMQSATTETVAAIQAIGTTIAQLNEVAAAIAAAVEQQGAATQEIARNVQQAAAGTTEVSSNVAGLTRAVDEEKASANEVQTAASDLSRQAEALRGQVGRFLAAVRAA